MKLIVDFFTKCAPDIQKKKKNFSIYYVFYEILSKMALEWRFPDNQEWLKLQLKGELLSMYELAWLYDVIVLEAHYYEPD